MDPRDWPGGGGGPTVVPFVSIFSSCEPFLGSLNPFSDIGIALEYISVVTGTYV